MSAGDVLAVLNRAAGDATGSPVEAGQAYAAIEAYRALADAARGVLCAHLAGSVSQVRIGDLRAVYSASRREACIAVEAYVALAEVVGDFLRANPEGCGVYLGDDCVSRRARMADLGAALARVGGGL